MRASLLDWLDAPGADRGIRFADRDEWHFWSYHRLAVLCHRMAAGLAARGVRRDDVVVIVQRSGPHFVAAFFGALLAGAVPSPVAPPVAFQTPQRHREHLAGLLAAARPAAVVAGAELLAELAPLAGLAGQRRIFTPEQLLEDAPTPARDRSPGELALLQFTSGSSGSPRGVRVPFAALESNVAAIRRWLHWTEQDATASWLPVHHDMGLIGCLLTPIVARGDLWLMRPEHFIGRPLRYLRCFAGAGVRQTAMPSFGLEHVVRRVRPEQLEGWDFSGWRAAVIGAERVDPNVLERFHTLLGPHGLAPETLVPAYGLAETTLAATGVPLHTEWREVAVEPASLSPGSPVVHAPAGTGGHRAVSCGRPLDGVEVTVAGEDGVELPDGRVGEIVVGGTSLAAGYTDADPSASLSRFASGRLHSGDAGFRLDGELFVLGRLGDRLTVRGHAVFAEDLEAALGEAGLPLRRLAVALGVRRGEPTALVVLEEPTAAAAAATARHVVRRRIEGAAVAVLLGGHGTVPRTSSGKPRRRILWNSLVDDERIDQE